VEVFDDAYHAVAADVLVNEGGVSTIQAGDLLPGRTYYLKLSVPESRAIRHGTYSLAVDFSQPLNLRRTFATGSLSADLPQQSSPLYVAQDQLFQFVLSASATGAARGTAVHMTITDATGAAVADLSAVVGNPASSATVFLSPGPYTVSFEEV